MTEFADRVRAACTPAGEIPAGWGAFKPPQPVPDDSNIVQRVVGCYIEHEHLARPGERTPENMGVACAIQSHHRSEFPHPKLGEEYYTKLSTLEARLEGDDASTKLGPLARNFVKGLTVICPSPALNYEQVRDEFEGVYGRGTFLDPADFRRARLAGDTARRGQAR